MNNEWVLKYIFHLCIFAQMEHKRYFVIDLEMLLPIDIIQIVGDSLLNRSLNMIYK